MNTNAPVAISATELLARSRQHPTSTYMVAVAKRRAEMEARGESVDDEILEKMVAEEQIESNIYMSSFVTLDGKVNYFSVACVLARVEEVDGKLMADIAMPSHTPYLFLFYTDIEVKSFYGEAEGIGSLWVAPAEIADQCQEHLKMHYDRKREKEFEQEPAANEPTIAPVGIVPADPSAG